MTFTLQSGTVAGFDKTPLHYTLTEPAQARSDLTLVFCNGVGMDTSLWVHMLEFFRSDYRTLTWDYRGHGLSHRPKRFKAIKITDHVKDLQGVVSELHLSDLVLLGHSMGVQVILEFFHRHPQRVRGLVPVCGSYENPLKEIFYLPLFDMLFPHIFDIGTRHVHALNAIWQIASRTRVVEEIALLLGTNRAMTHREDMRAYLKNLTTIEAGFFLYALRGATQHSAKKYLASINVPTLIVAGQWDPLTPVSISRRMAEKIPGATLLVIPQGSHCALLDQPELLNLETEKFLADVEAKTMAA